MSRFHQVERKAAPVPNRRVAARVVPRTGLDAQKAEIRRILRASAPSSSPAAGMKRSESAISAPVEVRSMAAPIQATGLLEIPEGPVRLPDHGGGAGMAEDVRARMESVFGVDFSPVRIHEGPHAAAIGALAYTQGTDIHFAAGQYQPGSRRGQEILGHELAHVVQQSRGQVRPTTQARGVDINDDAALERDADEMGARAARAGISMLAGREPARDPGPRQDGTSVRARGSGGLQALRQSPAPRSPHPRGLSLLELAATQPAAGTAPVQRSRLRDFKDADPAHEPSHLDDATIRATNEYKAYMNPSLVWQWRDHVTDAEALLACRLILRAMRQGQVVIWTSGARTFLNQARAQLGTLQQAEGFVNQFDWNNQAPDLQNTQFGRWLLAGGPKPDPTTGSDHLNCWEMVMYSAYRAGFTTMARLQALYQSFEAALQAGSVGTAISDFEKALRRGQEFVYDRNDPDSPRPLPGDIVIFNNLGAHVAVAIGEDPGTGEIAIMSLWIQNSQSIFRTTVEYLLDNSSATGPVRFFSPAW
jgi:hypothetical protein